MSVFFFFFLLLLLLLLFFFAEFEALMFHNNIVKISEKLNKRNLLKVCPQVTYPTYFYIIWFILSLREKVKIFDF